MQQVTADFVQEVEITCDLKHTNLVQLLGACVRDVGRMHACPTPRKQEIAARGAKCQVPSALHRYRWSSLRVHPRSYSSYSCTCTYLIPGLLCLPDLVPRTHTGFATKPSLLLVQELMHGDSLDKQLYIERWRPDARETLKVALDVARGMEYLHTRFMDSEHFDRP